MTEACVFCQIREKQIPANMVYEDEQIMVFHDIQPKAPVHLLVVPKQHIVNLYDLHSDHATLLANMMLLLPKLAKEAGLQEGFKTQIFTGKKAGQEVFHLHIHLLGG